jgi:uncharacterized membrane protein
MELVKTPAARELQCSVAEPSAAVDCVQHLIKISAHFAISRAPRELRTRIHRIILYLICFST